jgi:hypothetical protein
LWRYDRKQAAVRSILITTLLLFATAPLQDAEASKRYRTVTEIGFITCKRWLGDRIEQRKPGEINSLASDIDTFWLLGYLSGLNSMAITHNDVIADVDYKIAVDWTDAYCKKHQTENISAAGNALFLKLAR